MSTFDQWQEGNKAYLTAALKWLRLVLEQHAGREPSHVVHTGLSGDPAQTHASWSPKWRLRRRPPDAPEQPGRTPIQLLPPAVISDEQVAQARAEMAEAEARTNPPPALALLSQRFGLSTFERDVLLLCVATELDTGIASLCAGCHGEVNNFSPTFGLALAVFNEPAWDALSTERPLRRYQLITIRHTPPQSLIASPIDADEWLVSYVKGLECLDDRLIPLLSQMGTARGRTPLAPSQETVAEKIIHHLQFASKVGAIPVVQLLGPNNYSKQLMAGHTAHTLGANLYRLPAELLPAQAAELETLARLWERTSILLPVALYLDASQLDHTAAGEAQMSSLNQFLSRSNGIFFLDTRETWPRLERPSMTFEIAKPTLAEQQAAWTEAVGPAAGDIPAALTNQFSMSGVEIQEIAETAMNEPDEGRTLQEKLWDACRASTRPRLDTLAQRLEPVATWDDIVLPPTEMKLLRQLADQVTQRNIVYEEWGFGKRMNRGMGVSALFAGESGTGKTMAAEVIANALRLDLYRIDLSGVISKYIGETEKNLRRLFDAAENGGMILFFDEADAIFGKRSEVKDSHDRYANIEINYLLQRLEVFSGLAILATNMKDALDRAFTRRLRFIVNFPRPGVVERKAIWEKVFPPETPVQQLDFQHLARFNFTGAAVHSIALNAAFLAVKAGTAVTMPVVLTAVRDEFLKQGLPIKEADFKLPERMEAVA